MFLLFSAHISRSQELHLRRHSRCGAERHLSVYPHRAGCGGADGQAAEGESPLCVDAENSHSITFSVAQHFQVILELTFYFIFLNFLILLHVLRTEIELIRYFIHSNNNLHTFLYLG